VVDVLTADHRDITALIGEIWSVRDPMVRRDLTDTAISELVRHAVAEEMYVYPAMRKYLPDGDKSVEHDVEEHKQLERAMKELEGLEVSSTEFDGTLRRLQYVLADHVQDDESEQFPQLRRAIPHEQLIEMAEKVQKAKKIAPAAPGRAQQRTVPQAGGAGRGHGRPPQGHDHQPGDPLATAARSGRQGEQPQRVAPFIRVGFGAGRARRPLSEHPAVTGGGRPAV
jgi:hemerythrin-like domain-containing protein